MRVRLSTPRLWRAEAGSPRNLPARCSSPDTEQTRFSIVRSAKFPLALLEELALQKLGQPITPWVDSASKITPSRWRLCKANGSDVCSCRNDLISSRRDCDRDLTFASDGSTAIAAFCEPLAGPQLPSTSYGGATTPQLWNRGDDPGLPALFKDRDTITRSPKARSDSMRRVPQRSVPLALVPFDGIRAFGCASAAKRKEYRPVRAALATMIAYSELDLCRPSKGVIEFMHVGDATCSLPSQCRPPHRRSEQKRRVRVSRGLFI